MTGRGTSRQTGDFEEQEGLRGRRALRAWSSSARRGHARRWSSSTRRRPVSPRSCGLASRTRPAAARCRRPRRRRPRRRRCSPRRCDAAAAKKPRVSPGADAERLGSQRTCATATRQAVAKRVARRMLRRGRAAPEHEGGSRVVVLACCCPRLPPGVRCALHQAVAVAVAPREPCRRGGWAFGEYARWRRSVWMPTRFCLERVGQAARGSGSPCMDRNRAPRPALLVERTGRCAGVCVRRFVLVGDVEQAKRERNFLFWRSTLALDSNGNKIEETRRRLNHPAAQAQAQPNPALFLPPSAIPSPPAAAAAPHTGDLALGLGPLPHRSRPPTPLTFSPRSSGRSGGGQIRRGASGSAPSSRQGGRLLLPSRSRARGGGGGCRCFLSRFDAALPREENLPLEEVFENLR
ncbi:hypothetical protein ZWY2020_000455 [Hordeum vulgare]|nr:hypothetical protein ZWY2020_000455 [Hordeum vulgare]